MVKHDAKNPKVSSSNHATEPNMSEYGDDDNNNNEGRDRRQVSSIHNGNAWDAISKKLSMKQPRRLSF